MAQIRDCETPNLDAAGSKLDPSKGLFLLFLNSVIELLFYSFLACVNAMQLRVL